MRDGIQKKEKRPQAMIIHSLVNGRDTDRHGTYSADECSLT
jgi:hypothetical protein